MKDILIGIACGIVFCLVSQKILIERGMLPPIQKTVIETNTITTTIIKIITNTSEIIITNEIVVITTNNIQTEKIGPPISSMTIPAQPMATSSKPAATTKPVANVSTVRPATIPPRLSSLGERRWATEKEARRHGATNIVIDNGSWMKPTSGFRGAKPLK